MGKKVSLWLPNLRGSVIELVLMWYFRQDDDAECAELMAGLDEGELHDFGAAADYFNLHKLRDLCETYSSPENSLYNSAESSCASSETGGCNSPSRKDKAIQVGESVFTTSSK